MAFRRFTDPCMIPVGPTASAFTVPQDIMDKLNDSTYSSFQVINPNACYVRLLGSRAVSSATPVTETTGWLFAPGEVAVFGTQKPQFMSAMAVAKPNCPIDSITFAPLEISYGVGE